MKIYLAGPYAARDHLSVKADILQGWGYVVTSRWLQGTHPIVPGAEGAAPDQSDGYVQEHVFQDLEDIENADVVVLWTASYVLETVPSFRGALHSGGRHTEVGYALAKGKPVYILGEPENVFQRGLCRSVPGFERLIGVLRNTASLYA